MRYFKLQASNGDIYIEAYDPGHSDPIVADDIPGYDDTFTILAETTREPEEFETVQNDGSITKDRNAEIDTKSGKNHIKEVRMMKTLEATMILSGVNLTHGFLAEEAAARSVPLIDLAQQVYQQSQNFRDKELTRRLTKLGVL